MFIHIGERKIVSDQRAIGVFNFESLKKSELNNRLIENVSTSKCDIKTIVIDRDCNIFSSKVSPFTVIKRGSIYYNECVWRKG
jgi:regulator of extracellular matrix RemA (YlzA/DUF370 family)